jgi:hypothetical protein
VLEKLSAQHLADEPGRSGHQRVHESSDA